MDYEEVNEVVHEYVFERDNQSTMPVRVIFVLAPMVYPDSLGPDVPKPVWEPVPQVYIEGRWMAARPYQAKAILDFDTQVKKLREAKDLLEGAGNELRIGHVVKKYAPMPGVNFTLHDEPSSGSIGGGVGASFVDLTGFADTRR